MDFSTLLMDYVLNPLWLYVVPFLVVFTVLVFVHELGHYLVARYNGVRVEVFSIGFGPEIKGWTDKSGTRWKIGAVPLGGYVKMFGQSDLPGAEDEEAPPLTPEEEKVSFSRKRLGQRAAIVAAGPMANFVFAILVLAGLFNIAGIPSPLAGVGSVRSGSAADAAGLKVGDRILSIDGKAMTLFDDLSRVIRTKPETTILLKVLRDGTPFEVTATPQRTEFKDETGQVKEIGLLGISPDPNQMGFLREDPLTASWLAVERSFYLVGRILSVLGEMVVGERDTKELGGPIRIAQISGEICHGGLVDCIFFAAMLSMNLGLINLFPIPMLDGGHLVFYAAEKIRGRPLGPKVQEYGFRFGLILLLLLMIFVTWNDLMNLNVFSGFR